jgi:phage/plasmid-like protein (TIGR03299 family)
MAHNLDFSTGKAGFAFRGDRNDVWHRLGQQFQPGWTVQDWLSNAGLNWTAEKAQAYADISALSLPGRNTNTLQKVEKRHFMVRSDNGHILSPGAITDAYHAVQPKALFDWFMQYCGVDSRFQLDAAGSLKQGETIWATATYDGAQTVAGDAHKARLLMTTTFDGSGSTINRATMTRVVCNNTLDAALADKQKSIVRTRHNTKFDPARVGAELATIAKGFDAYKAMGEAMAVHRVTADEVSRLFKYVLDIPFDAKKDDISTRKMNQFSDLGQSLVRTRSERDETNTTTSAWTALNAVTRYADHERSVRGNGDAAEKRFGSSAIEIGGTGQLLKAKAVSYLEEGLGIQWGKDAPIDMQRFLQQPFVRS